MKEVFPIVDRRKIEAVKRLMVADKDYRDLFLFSLGINSGLRISDILALRWGTFLDDQGRLLKVLSKVSVVEGKTKKVKVFVLNSAIWSALRSYFESLGRDVLREGWVFVSRRRLESRPITRIQAWRLLNRYAQLVGIDVSIGTHTLRKTFGYHLYKSGVAVEYIQKMLNHSTPGVTLRYIGITQEKMDEIYVELNL